MFWQFDGPQIINSIQFGQQQQSSKLIRLLRQSIVREAQTNTLQESCALYFVFILQLFICILYTVSLFTGHQLVVRLSHALFNLLTVCRLTRYLPVVLGCLFVTFKSLLSSAFVSCFASRKFALNYSTKLHLKATTIVYAWQVFIDRFIHIYSSFWAQTIVNC